jgi:anti-anti-sigma factor
MPDTSLATLAAPPATPFTIDQALVGRRTVLAVAGEIDINTTGALQEAIESAASRAFEIWLDLTATTFMDSSGIHAIATARTRLTDANRRLVVICPDGPVLRVLTLTGFDGVLEIHPSRSAAHDATS